MKLGNFAIIALLASSVLVTGCITQAEPVTTCHDEVVSVKSFEEHYIENGTEYVRYDLSKQIVTNLTICTYQGDSEFDRLLKSIGIMK